MELDARLQRGNRSLIFTNLKDGTGLLESKSWLEERLKTQGTESPTAPAWDSPHLHQH